MEDSSIDNLGPVKLDLLIYVAIVYSFLYLIIFKGIRSTGKGWRAGWILKWSWMVEFRKESRLAEFCVRLLCRESGLGDGDTSICGAAGPFDSRFIPTWGRRWDQVLLVP